ncbi:ligase-associated DNA damage response endonuclease PdeM [Sphingomonas sp. NSE70-1]|uniref:Ligase-associated DNA damage response endonuclease PdeM n=1 Tax=Sphingomonas caseinilyticus TaxID=2908205 RepID=A0ABT0RU34_9SPHN|nr:ligase-associated DNA damage response endonuclease PdeM [Sphingomonas caseinilyticus]MCL6698518.1 ligase-associated DNA damage response endonuclease PdeM [Sphingomonas caseinilyticus]
MVPLSFAHHDFQASPAGAVYWPSERAMLVADLHLEKASWFARLGQMLPPYDSLATLQALAEEIERTKAEHLYCLGDSFHDRFGCERLPGDARSLLLRLTSQIDWVWIVGNHDPGFADQCGGRIEEECEVGGIVLRHEAVVGEARPEISGHFHPKMRLNLKGRNVSRRCFVASATKLILPAYGALTGGLDAGHPEIVRKVGSTASALVPVSDRMLRFPIAA